MKINLIAIGKSMPSWVKQAYETYAGRFPKDTPIILQEIDSARRSKKESAKSVITEDGKRLCKAIPNNSFVIALDEQGEQFDTQSLAHQLAQFREQGRDISLLIGGADGLSATCLNKADKTWSLSKLTLPHPLVRVVLVEQLYRAWSILSNHPYHRE